MEIKLNGAKLLFNPPMKPWRIDHWLLPLVICKKCGSTNIRSYTTVHALTWVDLNTGECGIPAEPEADLEEAREESERRCFDCLYKWEVSESDHQD